MTTGVVTGRKNDKVEMESSGLLRFSMCLLDVWVGGDMLT